jgi:AraC-like DNA-binding protein
MVPQVRHACDGSGVSTVRVEGGVAATPMHAHTSLILALIDDGTRTLHLAKRRLDLGPGDGLVVPPDVAHAWAAAEGGAHRVLALDAATFTFAAWQAGVIRDAGWAAAFSALHAAAEMGGPDVVRLVRDFLVLTDRLALPAIGFTLAARPIRAARRELGGRLDETLDLAELGHRVGLSPFHLHRLYRKTWGLTPAEHRLEARLRQARRLIVDGAAIADVAAALGFADQSHFSRAFRKLMGVPPGLWARQVRRS